MTLRVLVSSEGNVQKEETVTALTLVLAIAALAAPVQQASTSLPIEREAARVLADEAQSFTALGDLADRLHAALANPAEPAETSGRLALLRCRGCRVGGRRNW